MMETHYQVLLVEDDPMIVKSLRLGLQYEGFHVTACETIRDGFEVFKVRTFDAVLLDLNLPDGSGISLCQEIRKLNPQIPVLMVTAQTDELTAVEGLSEGADDYIRKPFGVKELAARMRRLVERKKKDVLTIGYGPIRMDLKKRMVWVTDTALSLGRREYEILTLLVKKSGEVVTRNDILDSLGENNEIYDRTIDSHLSHLRKKMRDAGNSEVQIVPVYGVGYRLEKN